MAMVDYFLNQKKVDALFSWKEVVANKILSVSEFRNMPLDRLYEVLIEWERTYLPLN